MLSCIISLLILPLTGCSDIANYDTTQKQIYNQNYNSEQTQTSAKKETVETSSQPATPEETQEIPTTAPPVQETTQEVTTVPPASEETQAISTVPPAPEETQAISTVPPAPAETQAIPTVPPAPEETIESPATPIPPVQEITYVLNTNTMKIHVPSCSSVDRISPKNYATTNLSIPELEEEGYSRCGRCLK
ncbi:MAG: hypothetical protein HDT13_04610 [Butyrivibrio sp.]|nr:hypothetical protein [Butyrivibrio sp.]